MPFVFLISKMEKILLAHLNALHFGGIALVLSALSSWKKRTVVP
jgi:hypothetical protein